MQIITIWKANFANMKATILKLQYLINVGQICGRHMYIVYIVI